MVSPSITRKEQQPVCAKPITNLEAHNITFIESQDNTEKANRMRFFQFPQSTTKL